MVTTMAVVAAVEGGGDIKPNRTPPWGRVLLQTNTHGSFNKLQIKWRLSRWQRCEGGSDGGGGCRDGWWVGCDGRGGVAEIQPERRQKWGGEGWRLGFDLINERNPTEFLIYT
ncbi:hypothetical protein Tco_0020275 [Tanacetum coccineum]